jgi:hypothetical protein
MKHIIRSKMMTAKELNTLCKEKRLAESIIYYEVEYNHNIHSYKEDTGFLPVCHRLLSRAPPHLYPCPRNKSQSTKWR